jgi:hypothetical protein
MDTMKFKSEFSKAFTLDKALTVNQFDTLCQFHEKKQIHPKFKHLESKYYNDLLTHCPWKPTMDKMNIYYDGNDIPEPYSWLEIIITTFLIPWNLKLNGYVTCKSWEEKNGKRIGQVYYGKIESIDNQLTHVTSVVNRF